MPLPSDATDPASPPPAPGFRVPGGGCTAGVLLTVGVLAAVVAVFRLTDVPNLDDGDQKKTAQYLLHLWQGGSWALPLEQGSILPTKPPLFVWLGGMAAGLLGGPTDLALRLPSAVAGVGLAVLTAHMGLMLAGAAAGFTAGAAVVATPLFLKLAAFGRPDMVLCLFIVAALWSWVCLRADVGPRWLHRGLFWVALGLGVLTKGPVAPAVALAAVALHLLWTGHGRGWRALRPAVGVPLFLVVVGAWFVPAVLEGGEEFLRVQVLDEVVQRVADPAARGARAHGGGSFLAETAGRFAPWTLFLPAALAAVGPALRRARGQGSAGDTGPVLPAAWLAGGLLVFLLPAQKRADYAMAFLPAAALLTGFGFAAAREPGWPRRLAVGAGAAVGLAGVAVAGMQWRSKGPLVPMAGLPAEEVASAVLAAGAVVALTGVALAILIHRGHGVAAASLLALLVLGASFAETTWLRRGERATLAERRGFLEARAAEGIPVVAYRAGGGGRGGAYRAGGGAANSGELFYLRTAEPALHSPEEVRERATRAPGGRLRILTGENGAADLEGRGVASRWTGVCPPDSGWVLLEAGAR